MLLTAASDWPFFSGLPPLAGAVGFALAIAMIMSAVTLKNKQRADTVVGVLWAVGMALGIIMIDLTPGYNVDLMSYLFGSILAVPRADILMMALVDVGVLIIVGMLYNSFLAMSFDEEFAMAMGVRVGMLYYLLLGMIALSVIMLIRIVGLVLVIALLTIPPFIAEKFCRSLKAMMVVSVFLNFFFSLAGLWFSYTFNLTSGATIIMVAAAFFFASVAYEKALEHSGQGCLGLVRKTKPYPAQSLKGLFTDKPLVSIVKSGPPASGISATLVIPMIDHVYERAILPEFPAGRAGLNDLYREF